MPRPTRETAFQFLDFNPYRDLNMVILGPAFLESVEDGRHGRGAAGGTLPFVSGELRCHQSEPKDKGPQGEILAGFTKA